MASLLRAPQLISEDQYNNVLSENTCDLFRSLDNRMRTHCCMLQTVAK